MLSAEQGPLSAAVLVVAGSPSGLARYILRQMMVLSVCAIC